MKGTERHGVTNVTLSVCVRANKAHQYEDELYADSGYVTKQCCQNKPCWNLFPSPTQPSTSKCTDVFSSKLYIFSFQLRDFNKIFIIFFLAFVLSFLVISKELVFSSRWQTSHPSTHPFHLPAPASIRPTESGRSSTCWWVTMVGERSSAVIVRYKHEHNTKTLQAPPLFLEESGLCFPASGLLLLYQGPEPVSHNKTVGRTPWHSAFSFKLLSLLANRFQLLALWVLGLMLPMCSQDCLRCLDVFNLNEISFSW